MRDTSKMLTVRPDKPVDPTSIEVIQEVQKCAHALEIELLLVGATARIILLENVYGLKAGRATRDIDFAFAVESWEKFNQIKEYLISTSKFEAHQQIAHRLHFKSELVQHKFIVDLIPFGEIEHDKNLIKWPPDMSIVMNVVGYKDALKSAVNVKISDGIILPIISIPGLAALKLFAWSDRGQDDPKDAIDFALLVRSYCEAGNQDRLYDETFRDALTNANYDPELTGVWLLGYDVKEMLSEETKKQIMGLLDGPKAQDLIEDMGRELRHKDNPLEYAEILLNKFREGLTV